MPSTSYASYCLHSRWREPRLPSGGWRGCKVVWVPATGRSRGLGRPARTCKLFPAVVARSVQHCSARVLLPSCGGGGGRWVPATRAVGSETPKLSAGSWKGQREGRILENSSAVREAPGTGNAGLPATVCYLCATHSATGPSRRATEMQQQTASLRPLRSARTRG